MYVVKWEPMPGGGERRLKVARRWGKWEENSKKMLNSGNKLKALLQTKELGVFRG
jgi:hypothetical protein